MSCDCEGCSCPCCHATQAQLDAEATLDAHFIEMMTRPEYEPALIPRDVLEALRENWQRQIVKPNPYRFIRRESDKQGDPATD